ncbi:hypothetical protein GYB59_10750 [bacterium]|uniref:AIG2 family protein n=1 Tax=Rubinisphaera brasiliensis (strain ATCC 49424 / DSM 5305 / JCM 21570 / IAM 15109 / NBRC 103401 / IFAM 1448) TaxID=756272 RepID=F0SI17_RUBBR|nr:hypothetical protein [Rubinisphaera brasiliensis]ADY60700.1 hypothetical protein Plabr_3103 [Rubinisphaera brasiliensis DSM 5305]MBR9802133.1 hypothetical protein [bacterium]
MQRYSVFSTSTSRQISSEDYQARIQRILNKRQRQSTPEYLYPWTELEAESASEISIVGFGSLINPESARRTLAAESVEAAEPCIVFGARRVYNYVMSDRSFQRYGHGCKPNERGVLNVHATGLASDFFNGLLLRLKRSDIVGFRLREHGYDLVPVTFVSYAKPGQSPQLAYCLTCRNPTLHGRRTLKDGVTPHPRYHTLCEQGCRHISTEFLDFFRHTTWVPLPQPARLQENPIPAAVASPVR